ncbi:MAG: hypothetical protein AB9891_00790 [Anaerolineaceae bacterium]
MPCRNLDKVMKDIKVNVQRVDLQKEGGFVRNYEINGLPSLIFLVDEKEVDWTAGFSEATRKKVWTFAA